MVNKFRQLAIVFRRRVQASRVDPDIDRRLRGSLA